MTLYGTLRGGESRRAAQDRVASRRVSTCRYALRCAATCHVASRCTATSLVALPFCSDTPRRVASPLVSIVQQHVVALRCATTRVASRVASCRNSMLRDAPRCAARHNLALSPEQYVDLTAPRQFATAPRHAARRRDTLRNAAIRRTVLRHAAQRRNTTPCAAKRCATPRHGALRCDTLRHAATLKRVISAFKCALARPSTPADAAVVQTRRRVEL